MYAIAIHGGAGVISPKELTAALEKQYLQGLKDALDAGFKILEKGGSALDAVQAAVVLLEDNELFNAGKGSAFTSDETHELEASIMCGKRVDGGAACGLKNVKNPILLARAVLEESHHLFLNGQGAELFADERELEFVPKEYFYTEKKYKELKECQSNAGKNKGTVGAVAIDGEGNLAAATSTGGLTNKKFGRIGDSPILGAGTYANNTTCAVSCTGDGEYFIRCVAAYDVSALLEYKGMTLQNACQEVVMHKLKKLGGEGGLIAIDRQANIEMVFNGEGMYRGYQKQNHQAEVFIY
ncbi:MAG: isoaspartyl peptidase/L-asparaginase family protein [Methylococcaceae bacterium]|nr:isoaspartyl peptidase/L-asparaginase [Prolixibacteraceae bacterium]